MSRHRSSMYDLKPTFFHLINLFSCAFNWQDLFGQISQSVLMPPQRCTNRSFALLTSFKKFLSLLIHRIASLTCSDTVLNITKVSLAVHSDVQFYSWIFWNHFHSLAHVFVCRLSGYLCFGSVIFDRVLEMSQKLTWSIVFAGIAQKHAPSFVWNISSQGIFDNKFIWTSMKIPK